MFQPRRKPGINARSHAASPLRRHSLRRSPRYLVRAGARAPSRALLAREALATRRPGLVEAHPAAQITRFTPARVPAIRRKPMVTILLRARKRRLQNMCQKWQGGKCWCWWWCGCWRGRCCARESRASHVGGGAEVGACQRVIDDHGRSLAELRWRSASISRARVLNPAEPRPLKQVYPTVQASAASVVSR